MTRVEIVDGRLKIEVQGWHKFWAFKSRLDFPLEHVAGAVRYDADKHDLGWTAIRAPGTGMPGVIKAGTYHWRGKYFFYDVCDFSRAVVIELREEWYFRVIVEVEEPQLVVGVVGEKVGAGVELVG